MCNEFCEPNHTLIHPIISITDGTYITFNVLLLPYNKRKVCSSYPPAEPKLVKTKIGKALWNDLKFHFF